jgi:hypothetical protein
MRMSLPLAHGVVLKGKRTRTRGVDRDGSVVYDPASFGGLRLHEDEGLFRALSISSLALLGMVTGMTYQNCCHDIGVQDLLELCHIVLLDGGVPE